jgi:hypothetical protein
LPSLERIYRGEKKKKNMIFESEVPNPNRLRKKRLTSVSSTTGSPHHYGTQAKLLDGAARDSIPRGACEKARKGTGGGGMSCSTHRYKRKREEQRALVCAAMAQQPNQAASW